MLVSTAAAIKPFKDRRVRQALALTLDRPAIIKQLFNGFGSPGNDSPFAAVYPSSDPTVPQRKQDLVQAKKLLAQAGYPKGFQVTLTTEKYVEIPQLAQILAASAKKVGIDIKLNIITSERLLRRHVRGRRDGSRHDAVAQHAAQHHGLRPSRRAERRGQLGLQVRRRLELVELREPGVRQGVDAYSGGADAEGAAEVHRHRASGSCCGTRR